MKKPFIVIGLLTSALTVFLGMLYKTLPPAKEALPQNITADHILIDKSDRTLTLLKDGAILKTYPVSLGRGGMEPKQKEGDKKTPEGRYIIDRRNAKSSYYRSLHISYPDAEDLKRAEKENVNAGSDIMVHGLRNGAGILGRFHLLMDWTQGCIAVTNAEMDELWRAIPDGTSIELRQ